MTVSSQAVSLTRSDTMNQNEKKEHWLPIFLYGMALILIVYFFAIY